MVTKENQNKINYIYKINENGEVCYLFDVTLLKFKLLLNNNLGNIRSKSKCFLSEFLFSKKQQQHLILILTENKLNSDFVSDIIHMFSNIKVYSTLTYNNYYINSILFLNWYNKQTFLLLDNIFFNYY